ncbi:MAG: AEC family transporter [Eubacterium sp.]
MIDMTVLVNQLIQLFLIICVGYLVFKLEILNETVNKHINSLVINVTMPLMIISSVLSMNNRPDTSTVISLFAVSVVFFIIMPVLAFIIVKIMLRTMHIVKARQGVYMFMLIFSNVGFMGMPILQAACGEDGPTAVFYAAVLNIFFNLAVFTYGVIIIGYGDTVETTLKLKDLLSPGILCSVIAIIIYGVNIHFPSTIENVIDTVGDLTSPLAMILVGSTLASMKLREVFNEWRVYVFSIIKQFVLPILLYPVFRFCISDDLLFNVMFIEFLMPIANIALMLATEYELDYKFVSKTIFISTLMSLVSIPLVIYLCGIIYA